jgi:transcriptional regulator with XRE-family HTH domain/quercetin dioxygenase-like cupin family protein
VPPTDGSTLGARLRAARLRRGLTLRALAGQVGVSASMISQIEMGKTRPSVSTLYAMTTALGLSLEDVFTQAATHEAAGLAHAGGLEQAAGLAEAVGAENAPAVALGPGGPGHRLGPHVRPPDRPCLTLDTGVTWERLGQLPQHNTDFLLITYPPGGTSSSSGGLMRHSGAEYGYVLAGELTLTLGFDDIHLKAGDAVCFESTTPHRYRNDGSVPAVGVWFVVE